MILLEARNLVKRYGGRAVVDNVSITVKQGDRTLVELPLTLAAAGAIIAPVLTAVGAVAALATNCSILVERVIEPR